MYRIKDLNWHHANEDGREIRVAHNPLGVFIVKETEEGKYLPIIDGSGDSIQGLERDTMEEAVEFLEEHYQNQMTDMLVEVKQVPH